MDKNLKEVLIYFLRLGVTGFGGPLALVAAMQRDLVEDKKWIEQQEFSQAFAMIKAMPGGVAMMTVAYVARKRAGILGGILGSIVFIAPAFVIMIAFAEFYKSLHGVSWFASFMSGMQAGALALIFVSVKSLAGQNYKKPIFLLWVVAGALAFRYSLAPEPILIIGSGAIWTLSRRWVKQKAKTSFLFSSALMQLVWICFKAGTFIFGSGLAIVPLLENDFVQKLGWLTRPQFLEALALGQMTPGPVSVTVTFIGYQKFGMMGAVLATTAIFFSSIFHMMTWFPSAVSKLSKQNWIQDFLFASLAVVCGTILVMVFNIAAEFANDWKFIATALICLGLTLFARLPSFAVIVAGALIMVFGSAFG